jgi:3'(2'), 5'-bisphosphate nucleotidase
MAQDLRDVAQSVLALSQRAGDAIMEVYGRADVGATSKDDRSPLTEADLVAHRILVEGLPQIGEAIPVLSEESRAIDYDVRRQWRRYWLVDPLDGTKEFLKRNGEFTVNVALIDDHQPVLGVVHAPALGRSYWACAGGGAYRQDAGEARPLSVAARVDGDLVIVASRSHAGPETEDLLRRIGADHPMQLQSIGSSLKLCLVAEGAAHLYPRFGPTMEWDIAAAQCVVEQAGGRVTALDGQPLRYNKPDLLNPYFVVTGPAFHWQRYGSGTPAAR